jgi:hypothetical protein
VSLERLENVLNASNINCEAIRKFWKENIGTDKSKATMKEICDSFKNLDVFTGKMTEFRKLCRLENIENLRTEDHEVGSMRYLNLAWNSDGDEWTAVFELNKSTEKYTVGKYVDLDPIDATVDEMMIFENLFTSQIHFYPERINLGTDKQAGNADDFLEYTPADDIHKTYAVPRTMLSQ